MKRITDVELKELPFGSMIKVIWHNSEYHDPNAEYRGVVFENKIGYEDGKVGSLLTIAECMYNNQCTVHLL